MLMTTNFYKQHNQILITLVLVFSGKNKTSETRAAQYERIQPNPRPVPPPIKGLAPLKIFLCPPMSTFLLFPHAKFYPP